MATTVKQALSKYFTPQYLDKPFEELPTDKLKAIFDLEVIMNFGFKNGAVGSLSDEGTLVLSSVALTTALNKFIEDYNLPQEAATHSSTRTVSNDPFDYSNRYMNTFKYVSYEVKTIDNNVLPGTFIILVPDSIREKIEKYQESSMEVKNDSFFKYVQYYTDDDKPLKLYFGIYIKKYNKLALRKYLLHT